jgi:carbonic anhydrase/acetyltransferase-like protein (isoleucine patch superfamily)
MNIDLKFTKNIFNIHESVFIAKSADILGKVYLGKNSSVWFQSVLRGDVDEIIFGENCNIQDGSIIHCVRDFPVIVGDNVSLGHGVILHGCKLGSNILIGMRATVLTGAVIGNNCLIAAGSLIPEGMIIPENSLVIGSPAKIKKSVEEEHLKLIEITWKSYVNYSNIYKNNTSI